MKKLLPIVVLHFGFCSLIMGSSTLKTSDNIIENAIDGVKYVHNRLNAYGLATATNWLDIGLHNIASSVVLSALFIMTLTQIRNKFPNKRKSIFAVAASSVGGARLAYFVAQSFWAEKSIAFYAAGIGGVSAAIVGYFIKDIVCNQRKLSDVLRREIFMMNFWGWNLLVNKIIGREAKSLDKFFALADYYSTASTMLRALFPSVLYLLCRRYWKRLGVYGAALISAGIGYYAYFSENEEGQRANAERAAREPLGERLM